MTSEPAARTMPPWWAVMLVAVAVAAAAFAIGRFSTFGTTAATPTSTSPEAGFARDMQVHHAQAIEMAMEIYRKTDDESIRVLSYDIATAQSAQKGEFYDWLVTWNLPQAGEPLMSWMDMASDAGHDHGVSSTVTSAGAGDDELMAAMGMATPAELSELKAASGTEADCLFLTLMIRHHEGALPMAQALIDLGSDPRALQVARGVIQTQTAEIDLMTSLQAQLSCTG